VSLVNAEKDGRGIGEIHARDKERWKWIRGAGLALDISSRIGRSTAPTSIEYMNNVVQSGDIYQMEGKFELRIFSAEHPSISELTSTICAPYWDEAQFFGFICLIQFSEATFTTNLWYLDQNITRERRSKWT